MRAGGHLEDVRAYYRKILPYYEKEPVGRERLAFWREMARSPAPKRVLEIGSGLGRICGALSRQAPTFGLDVSFEMLGRAARSSSASRARYVAADMREAVFCGGFDLIVAPGDPFSHLTALEDRRRALRSVAAELTPRGRFVLEGLYRRADAEYPERRVRYAGGVLHIREEWTRAAGRGDRWLARYRYRDCPAGGAELKLDATFAARAWNPEEIRPLFASCGLVVENLWGDFDRRPFRSGMDRVIIVARRGSGDPKVPR